ncbi:histidine kinase dimerization/phospho-acceptor domain-containing protein [Bacteriovorax sp. Seq25_V]|uniref:histidine kinase dimerization/phospho-acceptor domain-containing protein n=1 Tax=Bacteriovorax sp. Seq25_V TaxID=1201288 RepID=UPI00038A00BB|nr:histidine kinase dimerization/phospho-acceptor domain-containing protein [Bacteriovorax sp. Seq25_V]EQC45634.1 histidine kinase A domain protein [Bacteriovorax sp. Seq25_V]
MLDGDLFFEGNNSNHADGESLYYFKNEEYEYQLPKSQFVETERIESADIFLFKGGFNYINSSSVLFQIQDHSIEEIVKNSQFYRVLKRNEANKASLKRAYDHLNDSEVFNYFIYIFSTLRDLYNREQEDVNFISEVFKFIEFKSYFDTLILSKNSISKKILDEELCMLFGDFYILCDQKDANENSLLVWDLINLALVEILKEGRSTAPDNLQVINYSNLSYIASKLEYPVAILNEGGSVVLFNDQFSALNILPSNLLDYQDDDWIDINDKFYKIRKNNIDLIGSVFVLIASRKQEGLKLDNQSELGIITGSIAHELNNPVAGILAAVTILEFEEWDDENLKLLKDLKDSAVRCKELVDTFLGFSRYKVRETLIKPLGGVVEQALSLLRFRVIESGSNINVEIADDIKRVECKGVVLPMVIYLLFGELLTLLSHKKLIDENINKTLCLDIMVSETNLIVKVKSFPLTSSDKKVLNQKLIIHLLEMDNMGLRIKDDGFELSSAIPA